MGCINSRLSMEFSRVRNLEQHVLHDIRPEGHLELEFLALKFNEQIRVGNIAILTIENQRRGKCKP